MIPALISGGASIVGGLLSSRSSKKAANQSADAQLKAAQQQADASRYAADLGFQGSQALANSQMAAAQAAANAQIRAAEASGASQREIAQLTAASQREIAQIAAASQREAGQLAAETARFRPYGITTGFGTSRFDTNKDTGTYDLDPRLAAFRDQYYSGAQGVFGQMQGYDPQAMARTVYGEQQALLDPSRQAENEALRAAQLSSGRIGLGLTGSAVGAGTGGMLNPQQFSLDRARAQADAQMAFNSREYGQAELDRLISRGSGLMNTGFGIEELGAKSLAMGLDAGSRAGVSQSNQAQALLSGGQGAANALYQGGMGAANTVLQGGLGAAQTQFQGATGAANALLSGSNNAANSLFQGNQLQMQGILGSANALSQGQLGAANTRISGRLASDQALIGALNAGAGMFGSAFSGNYNPANWSNPAGTGGFYQNSSQRARDVGNMS